MSVSTPQSSAATSAHPFYLTIALQGRTVEPTHHASGSTPLGPTRLAQPPTNAAAWDVFDEIDSAAIPWTIENPPGVAQDDDGPKRVAEWMQPPDSTKTTSTSSPPTEQVNAAVFDCALADTHSLLYGYTAADAEKAEGGLPEWMKETSGRVTSMAVGHLRAGLADDEAQGSSETAGARRRKRRRPSFRLAVGCEDGNVWIFAPPRTTTAQRSQTGAPPHRASGTSASHDSDTASLLGTAAPAAPSLAVAMPADAQGESSRRSSASGLAALDTLSPTTKQLSSDSLRTLRTHRSSASIATLASLTPSGPVRSKRIVSASSAGLREPSHSSASLQSYDFARVYARPRKASATVSISTSPAEPSTACHSRARTPAPPGAADANDESDLPPFQTSSSPPGSPPISPTSMSSIPSVMVFPTSSPSSETAEVDPSLRSHRRSGSRAKDSIAAGIGLWETDFGAYSTTNSGDATSRDESETSGSTTSTRRASVDDDGTLPESAADAGKLEPVLQVIVRGFGAVVEVRVVEALRSADPEEGIALVVLRESGHLTLVSLLDGRSFGSCDVGSKQASTSRSRGVVFDTLQVLQSGPNTFAVCRASSPRTSSWALVDLETMEIDESAGSAEADVMGAVAAAGNVHFIRDNSLEREGSKTVVDAERERLPVWGCESPYVVAWNSSRIRLLRLTGESQLDELDTCSATGLKRLVLDSSGRYLCRIHKDTIILMEIADGRLETCDASTTNDVEDVVFDSEANVLAAKRTRAGGRTLQRLHFQRAPRSRTGMQPEVFAFASAPPQSAAAVTRVKQLPDETVLLGYSDGGIAVTSLSHAAHDSRHASLRAQLEGAITLIDVIELVGRRVVIAGSSFGGAGAWSLADWECLGRWTLFASPVKHVSRLESDDSSPPSLRNAVAFVSANSPLAFVSLFPPRHLFTLPGTRSSVDLVATSKEEVLVLYRQGLARTCDIKSRELRRSMDRKTAESVVADGGWHIWFRAEKAIRAVTPSGHGSMLRIDLRTWLEEAALQVPWTPGKNDRIRNADSSSGSLVISSQPLEAGEEGDESTALATTDPRKGARPLLSMLCRSVQDESLWALMSELDVEPEPEVQLLGLHSRHATSLPRVAPLGIWTISPTVTTQRLLQVVCLLRVFLNYPDTERPASEAILYFASCLADSVGPSFAPPSLDILASFWLDRSVELHQAARTLFGTYLAATPDHEIHALLETWSSQLPVSQSGSGVMHHRADHALLLLGLVAIDRMLLLSAPLLKEIATSIERYLHDSSQPYHQAVATELCSRGFATWQNYVDAMSITRQLFSIAIGADPKTSNDLRLLARHATLHIAGINTPLLMTTLLFDILNTPDAATRNATLKLLGFMIRKKPLVIFTNLPRVVDAVVKCLDPAVSSLRETVQHAATVILNELVRTYPSVDFHGKSQRIAVGTHEGAAVVYDLKTATRLYVLESHHRAVTALSWSPDGHRLVTASLDECRVVAWRVSGGLFGMFMSGAPPRAGSSAQATPYKTYDFHVGDEALMTTAATLEWVTLDWPAERTVRLRIRETALNFGV